MGGFVVRVFKGMCNACSVCVFNGTITLVQDVVIPNPDFNILVEARQGHFQLATIKIAKDKNKKRSFVGPL